VTNAHSLKAVKITACKNLVQYRYSYDNPEYLLIWHLSGLVGAELKEFLPHVNEMHASFIFSPHVLKV
jgi:hypothetical protein